MQLIKNIPPYVLFIGSVIAMVAFGLAKLSVLIPQ